MGIWDEVEEIPSEEISEGNNPYLTDKEKGFNLITSLLPHRHLWNEQEKAAHELNHLLNNDLKNLLIFLHDNYITDLSNQLPKIGSQLIEYKKVHMLMDKSIIGIGGAFSSGKSAFINSLLEKGNDILLPENQTPTTSISTYVLNGTDEIYACKKDGSVLSIDISAMKAMTHEFYEEYHIGFSRFIQNLAITTSRFPHNLASRIAFLDTPGYAKSDEDTRESLTDESTARNHLKAADFVIWLVSAENGTIKTNDIDFLRSLKLSNPVLLIFNKADKFLEQDCKNIITLAKENLKNNNINVFGITAYSSYARQEFFGANYIQKFLKMVAEETNNKQNIDDTLINILNKIEKTFNTEIDKVFEEQKELSDSIFRSEDFLSLNSLVDQYYTVSAHLKRLKKARGDFTWLRKKIHKKMHILFKQERQV